MKRCLFSFYLVITASLREHGRLRCVMVTSVLWASRSLFECLRISEGCESENSVTSTVNTTTTDFYHFSASVFDHISLPILPLSTISTL
jgi:hypothetical protein